MRILVHHRHYILCNNWLRYNHRGRVKLRQIQYCRRRHLNLRWIEKRDLVYLYWFLFTSTGLNLFNSIVYDISFIRFLFIFKKDHKLFTLNNMIFKILFSLKSNSLFFKLNESSVITIIIKNCMNFFYFTIGFEEIN